MVIVRVCKLVNEMVEGNFSKWVKVIIGDEIG